MFNQHKAAQCAAYLLQQAPQQRMSHLKLMKLLYLAEREAIGRFGLPMIGDRLVSMPHGPVLSSAGGREDWISNKENHEVALRRSPQPHELDALSPADLEVLDEVWRRFGALDKRTLQDWMRQHCAEWQDPQGLSLPIAYASLAQELGYDKEQAQALAQHIDEQRALDRLLATL
ncbi:MAG: Panacea domain-containing protein [Rhodocyclaceae bacterium]|nr:Panacea domain-containing protein [Rhodocyclaceae bacterium]